MTEPVKPTRLFAKGFIKLQEPPKIDVEPQPDGSIRVLPGDMAPAGSPTDTATVTTNLTTTTNETTTHGGTSTGTSTGTTTSGAVQVGGKSGGAIISGWDVRETEFPPAMDPGSLNFELAPGADALGTELIPSKSTSKRRLRSSEKSSTSSELRAPVGGARVASTPRTTATATATGYGQRVGQDSAGDSDSASESDADTDASGLEGVIVPFDALGVEPPFSRE